jgi:N-acetylmuramoyl-L-alanine amidase
MTSGLRGFGQIWLWMLALLLALPGSAQAQSLRGLSAQTDGDLTTVTLEFDGGFRAPRVYFMTGPNRLIVDIEGMTPAAKASSPSAGVISNLRTGTPKAGLGRVVADLAGPAVFVESRTFEPDGGSGPHRLVLQLRAGTEEQFRRAFNEGARRLPGTAGDKPAASAAVTAPPAPATPTPKPPVQTATSPPVATPTPAPAPAPKPMAVAVAKPNAIPIRGRLPVVVIDPGHGGQDPGAPSVIPGRHESEVTLAISRAIRDELQASGRFRVVLTRSTDVFIPLAERVNIARNAKADLFISVHADSIGSPDIRGATVYTLSETASDKEAERLAAKENKADIIAGINLGGESPDVTNILIDLAQRETMNYSAEFAQIAVREMSRFTLFRSNFHRFAGFRVLKAPDVPSILLETGYMSNLEDSRFLFSENGQQSIARGVRRAVEVYFDRRTGG